MFGFLRHRNEHWAKDRLSLYLDGRLAPGEQVKVESHLKVCTACREEMESLRATVQALRLLPLVSPPRPFVLPSARLAPRPVVFYRLRVATVAVAVLLVVVISGDTLGLFPRPLARTSPPMTALAPQQMPAPTPSPAAPSAGAPPVAAPVSPLQGAGVTSAPTPAPGVQPRTMNAAPVRQGTPSPEAPQVAGTDSKAGASQLAPLPMPLPTGTPQPGPFSGPGPAGPAALASGGAPETTATPAPQPEMGVVQSKGATAQPTPEATPEAPTPLAAEVPAAGPDAFAILVRESEIGLAVLAALMGVATVYAWRKAKKRS